jgi:hypothetical protein
MALFISTLSSDDVMHIETTSVSSSQASSQSSISFLPKIPIPQNQINDIPLSSSSPQNNLFSFSFNSGIVTMTERSSSQHVSSSQFLDDNTLMFLISFYQKCYQNKDVFIFDSLFFTNIVKEMDVDNLTDEQIYTINKKNFDKMKYVPLKPIITVVPINITNTHFFMIAFAMNADDHIVDSFVFDSIKRSTGYDEITRLQKFFNIVTTNTITHSHTHTHTNTTHTLQCCLCFAYNLYADDATITRTFIPIS